MTQRWCRDCRHLLTEDFRLGSYSTCPKGRYGAHWYSTKQIMANKPPTRGVAALCPDYDAKSGVGDDPR